MTRFPISCASCGHDWTLPHALSIYERQALESTPCDRCGAYTLCCQEPVEVRVDARTVTARGWHRQAVSVRL